MIPSTANEKVVNSAIKMYGKNGKEGYYDENGHLIYSKHWDHFHEGLKPHIHKFKWWIQNGIWRWKKF